MTLLFSSFYRFSYIWLCIWEIVFMWNRSHLVE